MTTPANLLRDWLSRQTDQTSVAWLEEKCQKTVHVGLGAFALAFGAVPRELGKADLRLTSDDRAAATAARPDWDPSQWTVDQAGRALLVLSLPSQDSQAYVATLDKIFAAGEVGELIALYQTLPLLPHQPTHLLRAAEGVRSNMKSVFCAVAHRNPFPAEQFDEGRWNQMILKCLFVGAKLAPVVGVDQRANRPLMRMLCDYARERWAAGRTVTPELWRPVGAVADDAAIADLHRVLQQGGPVEQHAAALALAAANSPHAQNLLAEHPQLQELVRSGAIDWNTVAAGSD